MTLTSVISVIDPFFYVKIFAGWSSSQKKITELSPRLFFDYFIINQPRFFVFF